MKTLRARLQLVKECVSLQVQPTANGVILIICRSRMDKGLHAIFQSKTRPAMMKTFLSSYNGPAPLSSKRSSSFLQLFVLHA